jgi:hypothetical protein
MVTIDIWTTIFICYFILILFLWWTHPPLWESGRPVLFKRGEATKSTLLKILTCLTKNGELNGSMWRFRPVMPPLQTILLLKSKFKHCFNVTSISYPSPTTIHKFLMWFSNNMSTATQITTKMRIKKEELENIPRYRV